MQLRPAFCIFFASLLFLLSEAQLPRFLLKLSTSQYYAINEFAYKFLTTTSRAKNTLRETERLGKLQREMTNMPFPCDVTKARSFQRPTSAHALRPGDIDIVGAMGDSLTAGIGLLASDISHVFVANRGVAFSAGGQNDFRKYLTLPNILKEFNRNLIGFSLGDAPTWDRLAQFNVAEPGAMSADSPHQARILIKRMRSDKRVNFNEDWKLVTMMIGPNDFCLNLCYEDLKELLAKHQRDLMETFDILYEGMPRLLINFIPAPNLRILMDMTERSLMCQVSTSFECPCLIGETYKPHREMYINFMQQWQEMDIKLANSDRYRRKDDFAIVVQPMSTKIIFPTINSRSSSTNATDYSYLSADCFHFSQKAGAVVSNAIWNNMMEPVGRKATNWDVIPFRKFRCPTEKNPFIYTAKNSPTAS